MKNTLGLQEAVLKRQLLATQREKEVLHYLQGTKKFARITRIAQVLALEPKQVRTSVQRLRKQGLVQLYKRRYWGVK